MFLRGTRTLIEEQLSFFNMGWWQFIRSVARWGSFVLACGLLIAAAAYAWTSRELLKHGQTTEGVVVRLAPIVDEDAKDVTYSAVVAFVPHGEKRQHEFQSTSASSPPAFHVAERLSVLYRADDPSDARIATFGQLWGPSLGFSIAAATFLLIMWSLIIFERWLNRRGLSVTRAEP